MQSQDSNIGTTDTVKHPNSSEWMSFLYGECAPERRRELDAHLAASVTFPTTFTGIGNQGFVFRLNTAEAATLQGLLTPLSSTDLAALRIGLSASASDATGGPETFNLATITAVPEPGTLLFAGTALVGLGVWGRKRLLKAVAA